VTTGTSQSDSRKRSERRRRDDVIQVRVTEAELEAISANAAAANLTTAEFLRRLGQGYTPKSKVDLTVVRELCAVAGDLGRLGGLLKLWLADKRAGATALTDELAIKDINELWRDIQKTYGALKEKVEEL
jgi:hypothetical protein